MMIIRILTQHFYPDSAVVGNLLTQLAAGLVSNGLKVEVYTSQPRDNSRGILPKHEIYKGVSIYRLSNFNFNKHKKSGAALNYIIYFFKTLTRLTFTFQKEEVLYLIVTNPPFLPFLGVILNFLKNDKFISLMYDVLPEPYINVGYISPSSFYVKIWQFINNLIIKKSSRIVVNTPEIKKTIEKKLFNVQKSNKQFEKVVVISNWADGNYFKPIDMKENIFIQRNNLGNKFLINYAGTIGLLQDFSSLLELAKKLQDDNVAFLFIGDGVKKKGLVEYKEKFHLDNIYFFGYQSEEMLPYAQAASHLSVVHQEKGVEGYCMPSKLCSILATGTPVLAICEQMSELAVIVRESGSGFVIPHKKIDAVIDIISMLRNDADLGNKLGFNARICFENYFTREVILKQYEALIKSIMDEE